MGARLQWRVDRGVWEAVLRIDGRKLRKSMGTANKRMARERMLRWEQGVLRGDYTRVSARRGLTLRAACDAYLEASPRERSTLGRYRTGMDLACAFFGDDALLHQVSRDDAAAFIRSLRFKPDGEPRARSTINNLISGIRVVFRNAKRLQQIPDNPFEDMGWIIDEMIPTREFDEVHDALIPFTRAEQTRLLAYLIEHDRPLHAAALIALRAGLRRSEVLALRWDRIDLDAVPAQIQVAERWSRGALGPVKTKQGRRRIPLSEATVLELRQYRAWQRREALARGVPVPELVVPGPRMRGPRVERRFPIDFRRALEACGIPRRTEHPFHRLRHTFCSELLARGTPEKLVAGWAGHTVEVLRQTYEHWIPQPDHAAYIERLDEAGMDQLREQEE